MSSPIPGAGKLRSVQALRAVAVGLVVCAHLSSPHGIEARYLDGPRLTRWMKFPTLIGVDLFFVVSGVIIMTTAWPTFSTPGAWHRFAYRRVTRIYPIYWLVTTLVLAVYLVRPGLVNSHSPHRPEIVPSFLILPQPGDPLVAVGWTLVYELYFYAVFTFALLFGRRWLPWIIGAWLTVTVALHAAFPSTHNPYLTVASNPLNLEFVLGVGVGYLVVRRWTPASRLLAGLAMASVAAVLAHLAATGASDFPSLWFRAGIVGVGLAVLVLAAIGLEVRGGATFPQSLVRVGDGSYSIYLWHVSILSLAARAIGWIAPLPVAVHAVALVALFALAIAVSLWLYDRVERPLLRAFHTRVFGADLGARTLAPARQSR